MRISTEQQKGLLPLRDRVVEAFDQNSWLELGLLTGCAEIIDSHPRLLRSLSWGDPDYAGNALQVLVQMIEADPANIKTIENYLSGDTRSEAISASSQQNSGPRFYVQPTAFTLPDADPDRNLLSAMMPFDRAFDQVYVQIEKAATGIGMTVRRADNVWNSSVIIQDIFELIFRSFIVVADFSGRNPNVFYEVGLAHALGKHVIPIAQHKTDLPFDLQHHRFILYHDNSEGLSKLHTELRARIGHLHSGAKSVI